MLRDVGEPAVRGEQRRAPPRRACRRARSPSAPPGRSSSAARRDHRPDHRQPVGAAEDRVVRVVAGHLRRHRPPLAARTAGCTAPRRPAPTSSASSSGSVTSAATTSIGRSPAAARSAALRRSQSSAAGRPLHRVHPGVRQLLGDGERDRARSRCTGRPPAARAAVARCLDAPAGEQLGLRPRARRRPARPPAPGAGTRRRRSGAATAPGAPAGRPARRTGRSWSAVKPSARASRPRGTPSTYAASSSASARGDATPAAASTGPPERSPGRAARVLSLRTAVAGGRSRHNHEASRVHVTSGCGPDAHRREVAGGLARPGRRPG